MLNRLRDLSYRDFEYFIADVWEERQGWDTKVMAKGPDKGLDVIGQPHPEGPKTALQCKKYGPNKTVGSPDVHEYSSLKDYWPEVEHVTIVTTGHFTRAAEESAERLDVKLIDGDDLVKLIKKYNAEEILEWYEAGRPMDW